MQNNPLSLFIYLFKAALIPWVQAAVALLESINNTEAQWNGNGQAGGARGGLLAHFSKGHYL